MTTKNNSSQRFRGTGFKILLAALVAAVVAASALTATVGTVAAAGDAEITVTDRTGDGLQDATVTVYNATTDAEEGSALTPSNGTVTFASLTDGTYYFKVYNKTGYQNLTSTNFTVSGSAVTESAEVKQTRDEIRNSTVSITSETAGLWGEVETEAIVPTTDNMTEVQFRFVGVNTTANTTTELYTNTTLISENKTVGDDYYLGDSEVEEYQEARIIVEGQSNYVNSTDYGTYESVSGGGGSTAASLLDTTIMGIPAVILVIGGVGGYLYLRD